MADSLAAPDDRAPVGTVAAGIDRPPIAGVVLAAGAGVRLRPLTDVLPKALCPVGNRPLVDLALQAVAVAGVDVAVNLHHARDQLEAHLVARGDVHLSIEEPEALGTAGAIGALRPWLDGRGALIVNADAWTRPDLAAFVSGWDGERVRVLVAGDEPFGAQSRVVASILPWREAAGLRPEPSGLWESCWRELAGTHAIDTASYDGPFVDCGTPARYLEANLLAAALDGRVDRAWSSASASSASSTDGPSAPRPSIVDLGATVDPDGVVDGSVVGSGAVIGGIVTGSVIWAGQEVGPTELLDHAVRASERVTVLVR